jgi:hypothetical protein
MVHIVHLSRVAETILLLLHHAFEFLAIPYGLFVYNCLFVLLL